MVELLTCSGLTVNYGAVEAVRNVEFVIAKGEITALLGANGAGKSSTLNALVGLAPRLAGDISFRGKDIARLPMERLNSLGLTLVPEGRRIFASLSVKKNLVLGGYSLRDANILAQAWERVYDLFPILYERRHQYAGTLSGGEQQMLALARALMSMPLLLLLDEPSLGLAPEIVDQIFALIVNLSRQGITIALVEQNVERSLEIADRAYLMASGCIVASGTPKQLEWKGALEQAYLGKI